MPPHKLNLKIGATVFLLRNLSIAFGLCNGTRLIIRNMHDKFLECEIIQGAHKGERIFILQMDTTNDNDPNMPFTLHRRQFPLRLAFAMTKGI